MRHNLKTLAIIFSVVLNLAFIGCYLYHRWGSSPLANCQLTQGHPLYEQLDLSPGQLQKFKASHYRFHAFVKEQGRKIKARQLELVALLSRDKPDRRLIEAKLVEIQTLQRRMQAKVIDHLLAMSRMFTPEQRGKFFTLIEERIEKSALSRPGWMLRTQQGP